jgi:sugar phosphate isomerase/epimerase
VRIGNLKHDYSLAHLTVLTLSPPEMVDVAARAGYRYVSFRITRVTAAERLFDLVNDKELMKETRARLADTGVVVNDVELFRMDPATEPENYKAELDTGAELGAKNIIAQLPDPDRDRAAGRFARLCDMAKPLGIFVNLEFPHWTETGNLSAAVKILRTAQRDNAAILVDMLHFDRSESSLEELSSLPREWFRMAHICDAPKEVPPTLEGKIHTGRDERLFPGEGGIDIPAILACMPPDIPYSIEVPRNTMTNAIGPAEVAEITLRVTRYYLEGGGHASCRPNERRSDISLQPANHLAPPHTPLPGLRR